MSVDDPASKTPETHPDDPVVGHYFAAACFERMRTEIYFCDAYDPKVGYTMVNVNAPGDQRGVSPRAIGRTWVNAEDAGGFWRVPLWRLTIEKSALVERIWPGEGHDSGGLPPTALSPN